ncbi:chaplin [Streptomyces sp. MUM 178J]|uniref:chaplin n=1 Tax=Streptomyces sp. MUM 178J TaxID=2791991 RepID=UPI001F0373F0|nr:chaplin [Streptomyces sp. MUM 178J]WRQ81626.1 chaplin [Streptomyces sp. MUM 178J]
MKTAKKAAVVLAAAGIAAGAAAGNAFADSGALGSAADSPGVGSGNVGQMPVHVPTIVCGDTAQLIGALNPTFGNICVNE